MLKEGTFAMSLITVDLPFSPVAATAEFGPEQIKTLTH
ncbi:Uncharacterized protein AC499_1306 [Pseudomonas amygdali pv. lachrymans]|uniref:Uncharacterized protein n=1 Tax=Pseudomonas amygdali pv. lachrymans TaxID=53707 RepID=A0ABR5KRG2_PSEAV|nr:Uncharacterized protein AC499_0347 [Pseudomonas amygdali pv. lachrymans]KPC18104.1 Uncharacterized protein AC499_1306 [Pseudomonas amygdali pv. lachrymans]RMT06069.1 hypothetical protein ALP54_102381 [Pseudomonas amygdali pv. lachrymans]